MDPNTHELTSMPDVTTVYDLLKEFFNLNNRESREYTAKYLEQLQHSVFAWKIADQLLINKFDSNSCIFAAQTLKNKIQNSFHELPPESYSSLKDSIINHLKNIQENTVQTQLCLAITYLAILVPNWTNPIEELVSQISEPNVTVEILICLVEELEGKRIKIDIKRREWLSNYLNQISPQVMNLLNVTLHQAKLNHQQNTQLSERLISKVYRGLGTWLRIVYNHDDITLIEPILSNIFESLVDTNCPDNIHEIAADTVCEAAILCEDYEKYQQLAHYLLTKVYELENAYHQAVALEEFGMLINFTRIFTDLAESLVDPVILNEGDQSKLLHLLLNCVGHYDLEIVEITFHFWYRFSELIYKRQLKTFTQVCVRLLTGLTKHCEIENDAEGILENKSDMFEFRCRVKDLVKEVIALVGAKCYLNHVISSFNECRNWEVIEANLFIISCIVSEKEVMEDSNLIVTLINLILSFSNSSDNNLTHIQIRATNCLILGELANWLKVNSYNLEAILNYLLTTIASPEKNEELSSIAASSLQSIIVACASKHLSGNINLVGILIQICCQVDFIKNEDVANNLLQCCSALISTSQENQEQLVMQLLTPYLTKLQQIITDKSTYSCVNCVIFYDRISSIFRNLKLTESSMQSNVLISLVNDQLWPLASMTLAQNANNNPQVIERCCRCLRFVIRCMKPAWLLQPIVTHIVPLYQQFPKHSSLLYLGSILVDEFASEQDANIVNGLIQMLNAFSFTTFQLLTTTQLRHHPDTIDDFFRLCTRLLQKCTQSFLNNPMLENILNLTFASIQLDHREANSSVVRFVTELIDIRYAKDDIDKLLREKIGQRLVDSIINASFFHLPTSYVPEMTDILWLLISWDKNMFLQWVGNSLKTVPAANTTSIMSASPDQLQEFYDTLAKATSPKIVASSLRYLARLYR